MWRNLATDRNSYIMQFRFYSSKVDWKKLRPMILKRVENRAKVYPIQEMLPLAQEVLGVRMLLIQGISILTRVIPVVACKFCPEVYIGEKGHLIKTCWGYRRGPKNQVHEWITGGLNDIVVPAETFRLDNMFQKIIKHDQRFDFDRVPAVVELCRQAGAEVSSEIVIGDSDEAQSLSPSDLVFVANKTLRAWETVRSGVQKLLFVYPSKVCKHCSEVHVGPSGHKARLCGIFKYESWRGTHFWKKAGVDDLVPPKIVWRRRPQDPPVLLDEWRNFYGHAPAVVDLFTKAGAIAPTKYYCMMKVQGLTKHV
ncbi:APO protein 4, mitochondrial [Jatropha curcas]|uniref:APO protein 4, mitochondrial n=1 Tax=Jatropha curcas TaxID=180498 RepID=UPI00189320D7|nr:APO protein 4, mitochondrial [Jatropha curcas]XP_037492188.1 APO protein 4, mitochondrial [Jatropha curcas]